MSDKTFEVSLTTLTWVIVALVIVGIVAGIMGMPWLYVDLGTLIFLTILIGLVVLIVVGGALLYFWGKSYMSRD